MRLCCHTNIHWGSRFEGGTCSCAQLQCKDVSNHETWVVVALVAGLTSDDTMDMRHAAIEVRSHMLRMKLSRAPPDIYITKEGRADPILMRVHPKGAVQSAAQSAVSPQ
jgi:hypothetical protein